MDVLYLDFDGVLHCSEVYFDPIERTAELRALGGVLFEFAHVLERLLERYPQVRIVLSTSWVQTFTLPSAAARLTPELRERVVGATYDPTHPEAWRFNRLTRYDQICADVEWRRPRRWLAVDDDSIGWPEAEREKLVLIPGISALGSDTAQSALRARLADVFSDEG